MPQKNADSSPNGVLPWEKYTFSLTGVDANNDTNTITFVIDFRDEDWSQNRTKYSDPDTHIIFDIDNGNAYLSKDSKIDPGELPINDQIITIWSFWGNLTSETANFKFPVTLSNKIEGETFDFGYLIANENAIASGNQALFDANYLPKGSSLNNTVINGTIDTIYNTERKYSFKWNYNSFVTPDFTNNNIYF